MSESRGQMAIGVEVKHFSAFLSHRYKRLWLWMWLWLWRDWRDWSLFKEEEEEEEEAAGDDDDDDDDDDDENENENVNNEDRGDRKCVCYRSPLILNDG